jgi:tRNA dimethylallyltransferase
MKDLGGKTAYFLVGPTASGKGRLARALAARFGMEIVSMDSMKVYRLMDIGTAKPADREGMRIHLLDVAWPHETFDLASWIAGAEDALLDIAGRGRRALFCGGTGLYLRAFLSGIFEGPRADPEVRARLEGEGRVAGPEALHLRLEALDPAAAARIGPRDQHRIVRALEVLETTGQTISSKQVHFPNRRPDLKPLLAGIRRDRDDLRARVDLRIDRMMEAGFLEEVRGLLAREGGLGRGASQALGYRELAAHLAGEIPLGEAVGRIRRNTRRFVRRQMAWFRRFPDIRWISVRGETDGAEAVEAAARAFSLVGNP